MRSLAPSLALFLMLTSGIAFGQPEQVTMSGGSYPTVSPDGNWVAYNGSGGIMRIPAAGGMPFVVSVSGYHPDWSPTGNLIAYDDDGALYVVEVASGNSTPLGVGHYFDRPAWSPDGTEIACTGDPSVKVVSYPDGNVSVPPCSGECHGEDPDWSPDGTRFCYEDGVLILTIPREGGAATTLVDCGDDVSYPAWSPDGRYVAFSRETADYTANHIWVVDVLTMELLQVTEGPYHDYQPAWAPASDWIYFKSDRSGTSEIWRAPFDKKVTVKSIGWGAFKALYGD